MPSFTPYEQEPNNESNCMVLPVNHQGEFVEAVYYAENQIYVSVTTGTKLPLDMVTIWFYKE